MRYLVVNEPFDERAYRCSDSISELRILSSRGGLSDDPPHLVYLWGRYSPFSLLLYPFCRSILARPIIFAVLALATGFNGGKRDSYWLGLLLGVLLLVVRQWRLSDLAWKYAKLVASLHSRRTPTFHPWRLAAPHLRNLAGFLVWVDFGPALKSVRLRGRYRAIFLLSRPHLFTKLQLP